MIFSSPLFLWALGLLAIPIIIHLFQFKRYKRLYFSDISLLKEVQTKSQTKNQLRHLLVLFARLFFIGAIVMAFAQPFIPGEMMNTNEKVVSIYVDNSLSMQNQGEDGRLLALALQSAFEIVASYPRTTKFQLITNELNSMERRFVERDQFLNALDKTDYSSQHQTLSRIVAFHSTSKIESELGQSILYLLSDFSNNVDSNLSTFDSTTIIRLLPLQSQVSQNVSIDSVWFNVPTVQIGREYTLHFKISNHGSSAVVDLALIMTINGKQRNSIVISVEPNSYIDSSMTFIAEDSGFTSGILEIEDSPITFDDKINFAFQVQTKLGVAEISPSSELSPFEQLFSSEQFTYKREQDDRIITDSISDADMLVLNNISNFTSGLMAMIDEYLKQGKNVFISLPANLSDASKQTLLSNLEINIGTWDTARLVANRIETSHPIYKDVFETQPKNLNYPFANGRWRVSIPAATKLIELFDGTPLLSVLNHRNASLFILSTELNDEYTNFHKHALFVPTALNIVLESGLRNQLTYTIGSNKVSMSPTPKEGTTIKSRGDSASFIPGISHDGILLNSMIENAGFYDVFDINKKPIGLLAFNYDRKESELSSVDETALLDAFTSNGLVTEILNGEGAQIQKEINQSDMGTELWPLFILLGLLFLLSESVLLKLFSR
ncbi:MAG: BatA domain-containing protein [Flavobacteriales bacterium]